MIDGQPVEVQLEEMKDSLTKTRRDLDEVKGQLQVLGLIGSTSVSFSAGRMGFGVLADGRLVGLLDQYGFQLRGSSTGRNAIYHVVTLGNTDPATIYPLNVYKALVSSTSGQQEWFIQPDGADTNLQGYVKLAVSDAAPDTSEFTVSTSAAGKSASLFAGILNTGEARVTLVGDNIRLGGPLFLLADGADPASLQDGALWYRTDTDKVRARVNGATRNLALENTSIIGGGSTLTIATGAVTVTTGWHLIDTEAAAATDDLDTISGTVAGQIYVFQAANSARDVVFTEAGNLKLAGSFTANNVEDTITMISNGTNLYELARSDNGA